MTHLSEEALSSLTPDERDAERRFATSIVRAITDARLTVALGAVTSLMTDYDQAWPPQITAKWAIRIEAIMQEIGRRQSQGPLASALRRLRLSISNRDVGAIERLGSASVKSRT